MKYILQYQKKDIKYGGFVRIYYLLFDSYYELQKHLLRFRFINKNDYTVFKETNIKRHNKYEGK